MIILALSPKHDMQSIRICHLVLATKCNYVIFYAVYAIIEKLTFVLESNYKYKKIKKMIHQKVFLALAGYY